MNPYHHALMSGDAAGLTPAAAPDPETAALAELHTRLLDTIAGYDKVLEKAEPDFRPVAAEFRARHIRHAAEVAEMLQGDGHDPEQDGSFFGTVNRALVEVRSWFDVIGANIMDQLIQGEKHVLDAYDQAIEANAARAERRRILADQRAALIALLDRHASA